MDEKEAGRDGEMERLTDGATWKGWWCPHVRDGRDGEQDDDAGGTMIETIDPPSTATRRNSRSNTRPLHPHGGKFKKRRSRWALTFGQTLAVRACVSEWGGWGCRSRACLWYGDFFDVCVWWIRSLILVPGATRVTLMVLALWSRCWPARPSTPEVVGQAFRQAKRLSSIIPSLPLQHLR